MADGPRSWLFLGHTLERLGPPVFLLELLRWLREHTDVEPRVVSLAGGALRAEFAELGPVAVVGEPNAPASRAAVAAANGPDPALVYVNTAWSIRARHALTAPALAAPLVTHVHELEVGLSFHLPAADRHAALAGATGLVAASRAVADNLVANHGVDRDRIVVHHEMIRIDDSAPSAEDPLRERLDIPAGAPVVGTAAVVYWRKGPDLFLRVARHVLAARPDAHLVWLGADDDDRSTADLRADLAATGLADRVHVVPFVDRARDWMARFDVFALTAREDAFPLACLEAAALGRPVVCFNTGGMPEFVETDAGAVVAYPDVRAFAAAVVALLDDPDTRHALGRRAAAKVRDRHDVARRAGALHEDLLRWERR